MLLLDFSTLSRGASEGSFQRFEIPGLLVRLARERRTGRLTLDDGGKVRTVGFADGMPTLAGSQVPSERLGQRLLKLDLITPAQLAEVDTLMCKEPLQFGEAMVRLGFVDADELRRTLRTHHNWIVAQCLTSESVQCTFAPYVWVPADPSSLALLQALEDGVRTYGASLTQELLVHADGWRYTTDRKDLELALRLKCSRTVSDALERLQGAPRRASEVAAACDDGSPEIVGLMLLLSGFFAAIATERPMSVRPIASPGGTSGSTVAGVVAARAPADSSIGGAAVLLAPSTLAPSIASPTLLNEPSLAGSSRVGAALVQAHQGLKTRQLGLRSRRVRYGFAAGLFAAGLALGAAFLWPSGPQGETVPEEELDVPEPPLVARPPPSVASEKESEASARPEASPRAGASGAEHGAAAPEDSEASAGVATGAAPAAGLSSRHNGAPRGDSASSPAHAGPARPSPKSTSAAVRASASPARAEASDDPATALLRACARYAQQGDWRQVIAAGQKVLALNPRHALAYRYLGIGYAKLGARAPACESYRRYLRFAGSPPDRAQVEALLKSCD